MKDSYQFEFSKDTLHKVNIMIEACFRMGGEKVQYEDGRTFHIAEITVDVKREFDRQINEQNEQSQDK